MIKSLVNTSIVSYIVLLFTMLSSVIIARHYGPEGQGQLAALLLIPQMIISYGDLGVSESLMYHLSQTKGQIKSIKKTIFLIFSLMILLMSIAFIIYILIFPYSEIKYNYVLGFIYLFVLYLNQLLSFVIRGQLKIKEFNISQLILTLFIFIFIVICVYKELSVIYLFLSYILATLLSTIYMLFQLNFTTNFKNKINFNIKDIYSYGIKTYSYKILNTTESQFDKFIIASTLPKSQLGFYAVAVVWSSLLYLLIVKPISSIILPILNKIDEIKKKQDLISLINKLIFWIGIVFSVFLITTSKFLIPLIYGKEYIPVLIPLWILLIGVVLKAPMAILGYYFKSLGTPEVLVKISIYTVLLNVLAGIIFIPKYGIFAAALISTISYTIYSILLSRKYMKSTNQNYYKLYFFNNSEIILIKNFLLSLKNKLKL